MFIGSLITLDNLENFNLGTLKDKTSLVTYKNSQFKILLFMHFQLMRLKKLG